AIKLFEETGSLLRKSGSGTYTRSFCSSSRNTEEYTNMNINKLISPLEPPTICYIKIYIFTHIEQLLCTINTQRYLMEILQPFIDQLLDDELQEYYFQQDGATPHCAGETLNLIRKFMMIG
ncbi:hypothetical protein BDFB_014015, partial [Asbolus verrucosus]